MLGRTSDWETFSEYVRGCYSIYGKEISVEGLNVYWELLKTFDIADVKWSFLTAMRQEGLPAPNKVIELLLEKESGIWTRRHRDKGETQS